MEWYVWLIIVIGYIINAFLADVFEKIAVDKGCTNSKLYFWLSFLFGPVGWAAVIALPDKRLRESVTAIARLLEKRQGGSDKEPQQARATAKKAAGTTNGNGSRVCRECGAAVRGSVCWNCGASTAEEARVPEKKYAAPVFCPMCGRVQKDNRKKCWYCGADLFDTGK